MGKDRWISEHLYSTRAHVPVNCILLFFYTLRYEKGEIKHMNVLSPLLYIPALKPRS